MSSGRVALGAPLLVLFVKYLRGNKENFVQQQLTAHETISSKTAILIRSNAHCTGNGGKGCPREKESSRGKGVPGVKKLQGGLGGNEKVTLGLPKNNNNNKTEMHAYPDHPRGWKKIFMTESSM